MAVTIVLGSIVVIALLLQRSRKLPTSIGRNGAMRELLNRAKRDRHGEAL